MPKKVLQLSFKQIEHAKPKKNDYRLSDGNGLSLLVKSETGSKTWSFSYYHPVSKKRKSIGLGVWPEISASHARELVANYRMDIKNGEDPIEKRQAELIAQQEKKNREKEDKLLAQIDATTLKQIAQLWRDEKIAKGDCQEKGVLREYRCLELHLFPHLGETPVKQIKFKDAQTAIQPVQDAGYQETVKRICRVFNEVVDTAVDHDYLSGNIFGRLTKKFKAHHKTSNPRVSEEDIPQLLAKVNQSNCNVRTKLLFELQLHTLTRPNEPAAAKWEEFDFESMLWKIPAHRMKKRREHHIPLTKSVINLLEQIRLHSRKSEYLFPNHRDTNKHASTESVNTMLKRNGFKGKQTSHGLRGLGATVLNDNGFKKDIVDICLAHKDSDQTSATYNHAQYINQKREVLEWWSDFLVEAGKGNVSLAAFKKGFSVVA